METFCTDISADPAVVYVADGHYTFKNLAERTYNLAVQQASQLSGFTALPTTFNVDFAFDGQLTPFQRPTAPTFDPRDFLLEVPPTPGQAAAFVPREVTISPPPTADLTAPVLSYGERPSTPTVVAPTPPPRPSNLVIPDAPDYVMPALPTFEELRLPTVPAIRLPSFEGHRPQFVEPPLNENWSFSPQAYVSELLPKLQAKVGAWLAGESALPPAIERALFDRGRSRIVVEMAVEVEQAYEEFGARGFSQPPGMLAARVDGIRQAGQNRIAEFNRDVTIKAYDETLANMRLALQQGIALEGLATNLHMQEQGLLLQSAQFLRETSIAILNARISVFNARMQAYQTDAQVFAEHIRAELAKVEVFRAQIEGERARGEINEQRARVYAEQVRALGVLADFYRTRVQAVESQAAVERSIIDRYRAEVDAYGTRWDAYGKEWDGYRAAVEAENSKVTVHRNLVDAFASRVQAYGTEQNTRIESERLRIAQHGQELETYRADLQRFGQLLDAQQARLQAASTKVNAEAAIFNAQANVEQAASAAGDRSFQLGLERARANVDTQLKAAEIRVQENIQLTSLLLDVRKMLAQVFGQLAASSMSAVNYSASLSSGRSDSKSCSTSLSYSGEAADLN